MKYLVAILAVAIGFNSYWTYRIYKFDLQQMVYNEYLDDKAECGIAVGDHVRNNGPDAYKKHVLYMYNHDIPACERLYGRHMCWLLNPKDDVSLDKCGRHFGYNQEQINEMKRTHKILDRDK